MQGVLFAIKIILSIGLCNAVKQTEGIKIDMTVLIVKRLSN